MEPPWPPSCWEGAPRSASALRTSRFRKAFREAHLGKSTGKVLWAGAPQKSPQEAFLEGPLGRPPVKALHEGDAPQGTLEDSQGAAAINHAETLCKGASGRRPRSALREGAPRRRSAKGAPRRRSLMTLMKALREGLGKAVQEGPSRRCSRRRSGKALKEGALAWRPRKAHSEDARQRRSAKALQGGAPGRHFLETIH